MFVYILIELLLCVIYYLFLFKQKTAYELLRSLVGSEMCIRDRAAADQRAGQRVGVLHHLLLIDLELGRQRLAECHRLGRDHVHQRTALQAREDRRIDLLFIVGRHQDDAAAPVSYTHLTLPTIYSV